MNDFYSRKLIELFTQLVKEVSAIRDILEKMEQTQRDSALREFIMRKATEDDKK